jgi:pSer/pThr/pTyr-binding forkhead associated (FHA) protein
MRRRSKPGEEPPSRAREDARCVCAASTGAAERTAMARLTISMADGTRDVDLGDKLVIGRVEGADLVLDDKGISRRHCEFERRGDAFIVRDLGSSNGTLVNGEKVTERILASGDKVRVGGVTVTFSANESDCVLRFLSGEHQGRDVPLKGARTTLGRRPDNTVAFADVKVSGVHVEVARDGDGFVLRDLGSTNGTFLDGSKVTTEVALSHGDRVRMGASEFQFIDLRRGEVPVAAGAASSGTSAPARAALEGPGRGKAGALLSLAGVVLAVGAGAAWYFSRGGEAAPDSGRTAAPAPSGTLLTEDWSFEGGAEADALWSAELGTGFGARRGRASSGSYALVAEVEQGQATASRRPVAAPIAPRPLTLGGQLSVDDGALGSVALRFSAGEGEGVVPRSLDVVAVSRAGGGSFAEFSAVVDPPAWAKAVEIVVVARGVGRVALDDLALVPGGTIAARAPVGDLSLASRGPSCWWIDARAPLAELFVPFGSGAIAPTGDGEDGAPAAATEGELPPGAFSAGLSSNGSTIHLDPGAGPFAPAGFALELSPELAANGVTLMGAATDRRFGAFSADGVTQLLVGAAAERLLLSWSKPVTVRGVPRGSALRLELASTQPLEATLRAEFAKERDEASALFARAQEESRSGRSGAALQKLRELRERLPHDDRVVAMARTLEAEIVPKLEDELRIVEAEAQGAEFFGSLDHYRRTLIRARALLAEAEGLEAARELGARVARMEATVASLERANREAEAARLLRLARAFAAQAPPAVPRPESAKELLAELQRSYRDTAAAREARGEPAGGPEGGD